MAGRPEMIGDRPAPTPRRDQASVTVTNAPTIRRPVPGDVVGYWRVSGMSSSFEGTTEAGDEFLGDGAVGVECGI
jgi:hypothetical protein